MFVKSSLGFFGSVSRLLLVEGLGLAEKGMRRGDGRVEAAVGVDDGVRIGACGGELVG